MFLPSRFVSMQTILLLYHKLKTSEQLQQHNTMTLYRIDDDPDLVKDMDSKALLNTNYAAYLEYKKKQKMENEIQDLKNDVGDIKQMLNSIVSLLNK